MQIRERRGTVFNDVYCLRCARAAMRSLPNPLRGVGVHASSQRRGCGVTILVCVCRHSRARSGEVARTSAAALLAGSPLDVRFEFDPAKVWAGARCANSLATSPTKTVGPDRASRTRPPPQHTPRSMSRRSRRPPGSRRTLPTTSSSTGPTAAACALTGTVHGSRLDGRAGLARQTGLTGRTDRAGPMRRPRGGMRAMQAERTPAAARHCRRNGATPSKLQLSTAATAFGAVPVD